MSVRTERLVLEPVTAGNAVELWRIMQSAQLRQYQDVPRLNREEFVRRVATRPQQFDGRAAGRYEWLIALRRSRVSLGWVSLRVGDHRAGVAEVGYSVIARARGQGYAAEATRALIDLAFSVAGVTQIDACCVPENTPSRKLLETVGFTQTRVQPNGAVVRGRPVDICVYAVTREEWARIQSSSANSMVMPASSNP